MGVAITNQIPMNKEVSSVGNTEAGYIDQIKLLNQEVIKQSNMRQNCEALLNKLQK
ncbi:MAG: hypothetical protein GKC53_01755 [Neisseriaceae bacterium]|nr:MAG: hypothetical protein GKC53_01755 [Neisseriaceae bacterium]